MSNTIDSSNKDTIEYALDIVRKPANSFGDWRVKGLGLQLTLFGLAEKHAERVSKLSRTVIQLEDVVFDPATLREIEPSKVVALYQMSVQALRDSSEYIRSTLGSMDWNNVEAQLIQMSTEIAAEAGDSNISEIANELIKRMGIQVNSQPAGIPSPTSPENDTLEISSESVNEPERS